MAHFVKSAHVFVYIFMVLLTKKRTSLRAIALRNLTSGHIIMCEHPNLQHKAVSQSINQSMHMRVLSPMWEGALTQQEFLENNVIIQFIIYKVKQNY